MLQYLYDLFLSQRSSINSNLQQKLADDKVFREYVEQNTHIETDSRGIEYVTKPGPIGRNHLDRCCGKPTIRLGFFKYFTTPKGVEKVRREFGRGNTLYCERCSMTSPEVHLMEF